MPGLIGLNNIKNTDYVNVVVQSLSRVPPAGSKRRPAPALGWRPQRPIGSQAPLRAQGAPPHPEAQPSSPRSFGRAGGRAGGMAGAVRPASECPRHAHLLLISRPRDAHLPSERPRDGGSPTSTDRCRRCATSSCYPPTRTVERSPGCPSLAPAPPRGAPGGSGWLVTSTGRGRGRWAPRRGRWAPRHCLRRSCHPPPKSPVSPPLTLQANYAHVKSNLVKEFGALLRKMWSPHNFKGQVSPHELLQATAHMHHATHQATHDAHAPCHAPRYAPRPRHAPHNAGGRARV